jgi:hypothetical protein
MVGFVWFIQIGFFPLLPLIPDDSSEKFHEERRTNFMMIMFPVMGMEAMSSLFLLIKTVNGPLFSTFSVSFLLLLGMFFLSFFGIYPIYNQLKEGFNQKLFKKLQLLGWIRVMVWSIRFIILISIIQAS